MSSSDVSQALSSSLVETADFSKNSPVSNLHEYIDQLFAGSDRDFLRSAISREEGRFLAELASRPHVRNTVEIGCANGVSSIYICAGISAKQNPSHTAIDPFHTSHFQGRGVANVARVGFPFFELIEQPSEIALPNLLSSGKSFDMAFIDGLHTADQTLLDFYYLDRLISVGGIIAIDDVNARAVNKIVHYISTYQNYRLIGTAGRRATPRRALNLVKQIVAMGIWPFRKIVGEATAREFFDISLLHPEHLWTLDFCTMVAFEKTHEYTRDTNWYRGM
jgi:predicted O-methyltransferase YrrM